jgi:hypothetical protein
VLLEGRDPSKRPPGEHAREAAASQLDTAPPGWQRGMKGRYKPASLGPVGRRAVTLDEVRGEEVDVSPEVQQPDRGRGDADGGGVAGKDCFLPQQPPRVEGPAIEPGQPATPGHADGQRAEARLDAEDEEGQAVARR